MPSIRTVNSEEPTVFQDTQTKLYGLPNNKALDPSPGPFPHPELTNRRLIASFLCVSRLPLSSQLLPISHSPDMAPAGISVHDVTVTSLVGPMLIGSWLNVWLVCTFPPWRGCENDVEMNFLQARGHANANA